jgi:hypothetical protein
MTINQSGMEELLDNCDNTVSTLNESMPTGMLFMYDRVEDSVKISVNMMSEDRKSWETIAETAPFNNNVGMIFQLGKIAVLLEVTAGIDLELK